MVSGRRIRDGGQTGRDNRDPRPTEIPRHGKTRESNVRKRPGHGTHSDRELCGSKAHSGRTGAVLAARLLATSSLGRFHPGSQPLCTQEGLGCGQRSVCSRWTGRHRQEQGAWARTQSSQRASRAHLPRRSAPTEVSPPGLGDTLVSKTHPAHSTQRSQQLPRSTQGGTCASSLLFRPSVVSRSL